MLWDELRCIYHRRYQTERLIQILVVSRQLYIEMALVYPELYGRPQRIKHSPPLSLVFVGHYAAAVKKPYGVLHPRVIACAVVIPQSQIEVVILPILRVMHERPVVHVGQPRRQGNALQGRAAIECLPANDGQPFGQGDACQGGASGKGVVVDFHGGGGQGDGSQRRAACECVAADFLHPFGQGDALQRGASVKRPVARAGQSLRESNAFYRGASAERIAADFAQPFRQGEAGQRGAFHECPVAYLVHFRRKGKAFQRRAAPEGIAADAPQAFGQGDALQGGAPGESAAADGGDGILRSLVFHRGGDGYIYGFARVAGDGRGLAILIHGVRDAVQGGGLRLRAACQQEECRAGQ